MRNLEQSVGVHRVVKGPGRTEPGDPEGIFHIPLGHSPHCRDRWAVCFVRNQQLTFHILYQAAKHQRRRGPTADELMRVRDTFFEDHEIPIQHHPKKDKWDHNITLQ